MRVLLRFDAVAAQDRLTHPTSILQQRADSAQHDERGAERSNRAPHLRLERRLQLLRVQGILFASERRRRRDRRGRARLGVGRRCRAKDGPERRQHTLSRRLRRFLRRDDGRRSAAPLVHGARDRAPRHAILLHERLQVLHRVRLGVRHRAGLVRRDRLRVRASRVHLLERRPERASSRRRGGRRRGGRRRRRDDASRELANGASHLEPRGSRSVARVVESRHVVVIVMGINYVNP